jgi:hypothetical protein
VLMLVSAFAVPSYAKAVDITPPVISLVGGPVSAAQGQYNEPGYSATDDVDGDITSNVAVTGLGTDVGTYNVAYNVFDSALNAAITQFRSVSIYANGFASPCVVNNTCPCPISADPISGDRPAWKACVMKNYPKLSDGSTIVCRLTPTLPWEAPKCAKDQEGFGEMVIHPDGIETLR